MHGSFAGVTMKTVEEQCFVLTNAISAAAKRFLQSVRFVFETDRVPHFPSLSSVPMQSSLQ